jgi:two-component system nitrogen regulation response regulator GlnG
VNYFLGRFAEEQRQAPKSVSADTLLALERYRWPGNVRELENAIEHATVVSKGEAILPADLPAEITSGGESLAVLPVPPVPTREPGAAPAAPAGGTPDLAGLAEQLFRWAREHPELKVVDAVERELVINALRETRGNQVQASRLLGMTRATLRKRIERFGIRQQFNVS